ncbi:MAG: protein-disulfide reductase DsbD family protein [Gammaproteobacteria bacterium]|nr:protein-disulfide reductase DsbD family protein [Gammaproteobacteria bacterium]
MNISTRLARIRSISPPLMLMSLLLYGLATIFTGGPSGGLATQGLPGTGNRMFSEPKFLPVDEAFRYYTSLPEPGVVVVHWDIAQGYYLYREKFVFSAGPTVEDAEMLSAELPAGVAHHDEFFGAVEVYYGQVEARVSIEAAAQPLTLIIEYQGCSEQGLCYPPQQREIELE